MKRNWTIFSFKLKIITLLFLILIPILSVSQGFAQSTNNSTTSTTTFNGTTLNELHYGPEKLESVITKITSELESADNEEDEVIKKITTSLISAKQTYTKYIFDNKDHYSPETVAYTAYSKAINVILNTVDSLMDFDSNTLKSISNDSKVNSAYVNIKQILKDVNTELVGSGTIVDNTLDRDTAIYKSEHSCPPGVGFWDFINPLSTTDMSSCSIVAYLVNQLLDFINWTFYLLLTLIVSLFNWSINFGIENFSNLIEGSGAYLIYQKIILALLVSLILPFVFYLIIRALLDNDTDKLQKILPRLLFTALFVYFSFTICGLIIDQANIFTLKIASTLNSSSQPLADSIKTSIVGNSNTFTNATSKIPSPGSSDSILVYLIQVLITGTAILVFAQATALIFLRAVILLLCLIFSPIMLLPNGIHSKIDEYKKMLTTYFTNNVLLAPIFMFLVLIALKIANVGAGLVDSANLPTVGDQSSSFIAAAVSGVISIIVLMLAISIAKKMSGSLGTAIGGKISALTGRVAFGSISGLAKGGVNTLANSERFKGWVAKGGRAGRVANNLVNTMQNQTYDLRNSKTFQKATGNTFGSGTRLSAEDTFNRKYNKERAYHNILNEESKEKHLSRLNSYFATKPIARKLKNNDYSSVNDTLKSNQKFSKKFDKANGIQDETKREKALNQELDKHFKANGKGDKYFSTEMNKPENQKFKKDFEEANKKTDEKERKDAVLKVVKDFEESMKNKNNSATNNTKNAAGNANPQTGNGVLAKVAANSTNQNVQNYANRKQNREVRQQAGQQYVNQKQQNAKKGQQIGAQIRDQKAMQQNISNVNKGVQDLNKNLQNLNTNSSNISKGVQDLNKNFSDGLKTLNASLIGSVKNTRQNPNQDLKNLNEDEENKQAA